MDKIKKFFVMGLSGIVLFIVYIFIAFVAASICGYGINNISENRIDLIICVCIAGIITLILYSLSMKILGIGYEKVSDYIPSAVLFCSICFGMCIMNSYSGSVIFICGYLLVMYVVANAIHFLIHEWKESKGIRLKIKCSLKTIIIIFLIINLMFWCLGATDIVWGIALAVVTSYLYAAGGVAAFIIFNICCSIVGRKKDNVSRQTEEDLPSDMAEGEGLIGEDELANGFEPYKKYDLQKSVLENIKKFLLDSGNDFLLIDEEYHVQAGKDAYYPDLLLYHMKLQCFVAVDLKTDDFKPEYLDMMDVYLETLDRDVKKAYENPSVGIILCKNEDTEVVEYYLNKELSQEMTVEYEAKLIDKEILQKKLGELYDRAKETNPVLNT